MMLLSSTPRHASRRALRTLSALALIALVSTPGCISAVDLFSPSGDTRAADMAASPSDASGATDATSAGYPLALAGTDGANPTSATGVPAPLDPAAFDILATGILPRAGWVMYRIPLDRAVNELDYEITLELELMRFEDRHVETAFAFFQPPMLRAPGADALDEPHLVVGDVAAIEAPVQLARVARSDVPSTEVVMLFAADLPVKYTIRTSRAPMDALPITASGAGAAILNATVADPVAVNTRDRVHNEVIPNRTVHPAQGPGVDVAAEATLAGIQLIALDDPTGLAHTREVRFSNGQEDTANPTVGTVAWATPFAPAGPFSASFRGAPSKDGLRAVAIHIAADMESNFPDLDTACVVEATGRVKVAVNEPGS